MSMHMSTVYAYEKRCFGGTYRGRIGGGCVWIRSVSGLSPLGGGFTYVFPPCASELIPCHQSYSTQKSVCKDKCLKAAACHIVVKPRVPNRSLAKLGYDAIK